MTLKYSKKKGTQEFKDVSFNVDFGTDNKLDKKTKKETNLKNKEESKQSGYIGYTLRIDRKLKEKFQQLAGKFYFVYGLGSTQQTYLYVLFNILKNIEKSYISMYGKILEPNETYISFYKKKQTKGLPLPPGVYLDKPEYLAILTSENTMELYIKLMHTYFINELQKQGVLRYSSSFYFYVIVSYFENNMDKLEIFEYYDKKKI